VAVSGNSQQYSTYKDSDIEKDRRIKSHKTFQEIKAVKAVFHSVYMLKLSGVL
jgi:hypothetical protein